MPTQIEITYMPGFIKEHIIPILFCIGLLTFTGCELIEYHPYDTRIRGEKDINRTQIEILETACSQKETIRSSLWATASEDMMTRKTSSAT